MSWSNGLTGHDVSQTIVPIASQVLTFVNVSFALLLIFVSPLKTKKGEQLKAAVLFKPRKSTSLLAEYLLAMKNYLKFIRRQFSDYEIKPSSIR